MLLNNYTLDVKSYLEANSYGNWGYDGTEEDLSHILEVVENAGGLDTDFANNAVAGWLDGEEEVLIFAGEDVEIYARGGVSFEMYAEEIGADGALVAYIAADQEDEMDISGVLVECEFEWAQECNPASQGEKEEILYMVCDELARAWQEQ